MSNPSNREQADASDSIFSRIIRGEVPSHKIYEDEHCIAILDVNPLSEGHALLIPKEPAASLHELSDDAASALGRVLPRLCRALMHATGCPAYNVLQNNGAEAGQSVFHVHFHVIPRFPERDLPISGRPEPDRGPGLGLGWHPGTLTPDAAADLNRKLARLL